MVDLDEMICFCGSVTAGDIKAAVEAGPHLRQLSRQQAHQHIAVAVSRELKSLLKNLSKI